MSNPIAAGVDLSTKVLENVRRQLDANGNWSVYLTYNVKKDDAYSQSPAYGDAIPSPYSTDHPNLICVGVDISDAPNGYSSKMVVTYTEPTGFLLVPGTGAIRSTRSAINEKIVDEELASASEIEGLKALDRRVVTRFTVEYSRRSIETSFAWTQASVIDGLGKQSTPTGLTSPTAKAWLKTERNATELAAGGDVELTETWMYDENLWNDDLFAP